MITEYLICETMGRESPPLLGGWPPDILKKTGRSIVTQITKYGIGEPMKVCGKCKRSHPEGWAVPFTLPPYFPSLREAHKQNMICDWCWRDYKGRRRPLEDEWKAGQFLHSLVVMAAPK